MKVQLAIVVVAAICAAIALARDLQRTLAEHRMKKYGEQHDNSETDNGATTQGADTEKENDEQQS